MPTNSFGAASNLRAGDTDYRIFGLRSLEEKGVGNISRLPFTTKILLENLLRQEDGRRVAAADIEYVARGASGSAARDIFRSEEHTSELQSPMYLVCRLLLEK